jgi:1,4-alpha-glucan branching enzyme
MRKRKEDAPEGMGAIIHKDGVAFRVWAPNADEVFVVGTFNDWSPEANPLHHEGNGYWVANVAEANAGDEYKYRILNGKEDLCRVDPYARELTHSAGNSLICDPNSFDWGDDDFQMAPWNELVIYEMHIGAFNARSRKKPGDFESAIEKLDHLQELGVNAIQPLPVMEFPGDYSWGYNPCHLFAVESTYGGADGFKAFVKEAHARGIAVIVDVVYNHMGPDDVDLWRFDGWYEDDGGGIYFYNDWRAETPWGDSRFDYDREEVRRYLRDNALMWFEEFHVDGLRWDGTAFIRNVEGMGLPEDKNLPSGWSLMRWLNDEIHERFPGAISIAEDLQNDPAMTQPTADGGAGFDAEWDPEFVHPVRETMIATGDEERDLDRIRDAICRRINGDAFKRVIYTESHDQVANGSARLPEEIVEGEVENWYAKKRSTLGAALAMTTPGIPMLFQGQEMLEDEWFRAEDPLEWKRKEEFKGIFKLYQDLIRVRRNQDGHTRGLTGQHVEVHHLNHEQKIIGFHRWAEGGPGDSVVVLANLSADAQSGYAIGFPEEGKWRLHFNSDWDAYDKEFDSTGGVAVEAKPGEKDGMPSHGVLDIGAYSLVVLSQE